MRKNELIILGMGTTRRQCLFNDNNIEIWSCNTGYSQIAEMNGYIHKIFMSHNQHVKLIGKEDGTVIRGNAYNIAQFNLLAEHGVEIYNIHKIRGMKMKMYPLKRIDRKLGANGFFSNTISYMLAYAIDKSTRVVDGEVVLRKDGLKKIYIYGVDMLTKDEYELEKGGIEYWIGYARGLGIKVEIAKESALCKTCTGKPYGVKFFNLKDIDPWSMFDCPGKEKVWKDQAMPTRKQWREITRNLVK